jgi:hypothetical protein
LKGFKNNNSNKNDDDDDPTIDGYSWELFGCDSWELWVTTIKETIFSNICRMLNE